MRIRALALVAALFTGSRFSTTAEAQIVRVEVTSREAPALGGASFGHVGRYERIAGRAYGEVDPADARNTIITDLQLAPRNAQGRVEYATDFVLLKPIDMSAANGILRYFAPNRGGGGLPADSIYLAEGTVFLLGAWQGDVPPSTLGQGAGPQQGAGGRLRVTLQVPIAKNADGSAITGPIRVEFVGRRGTVVPEMPLQGSSFNSGMIPYQPVDLDDSTAVLTRRVQETDARVFVPNQDWSFATCNATDNPFPGKPDPTRVCLKGGFQSDYLYELIYTARDPKVMGLGLAAVRDLVSFFRFEATDSQGNENPLGTWMRYAMGTGVSQAGNFMKTFVHLGFNQDTQGRRVFDALFPVVAARQTNLNMRFAVPGGGGGLRTDHRAVGQAGTRGFAADYRDDLRGTTGGIFTRCTATKTCPKTFLAFSGTEMWVLQGAPALVDPFGTRDLIQPDSLRIYYFAGTQHGSAARTTWNPDATVYPVGPESKSDDAVRALWLRLQEWMVRGTPPPPSRVPTIAGRTLVHPEDLRFPVMKGLTFPVQGVTRPIPEFRYLGWYNKLSLLDFGPRFNEPDESGVADVLPPAYLGRDYAIMVSAVDRDGNEVAGVQPIGNRVPLGTNLTFNYNADPRLHDLGGLSGAFIPFHQSRAERMAAGDERPSLEERYGTHDGYVAAVRKATGELVAEGFLLQRDAARVIAEAQASTVLK